MGARLAIVWMKELSSAPRSSEPIGLEHWVVGFHPPETLNALPSRDSEIRMANSLMLERVHKRSLAYACFTRYEDHLSLATQSHLQTIVQPGKSILAPHYLPGEVGRCIRTAPLCGRP